MTDVRVQGAATETDPVLALPDRSPGRRRRRRLVLPALAVVLLLVLAFTWWRLDRAARAGLQGKASLLRAESALADRDVDGARAALAEAGDAFDRSRREVRTLGPIGWVGRRTPLLRVQLRAADAYADTGRLLTQSGERLTAAAAEVVEPDDPDRALSSSLAILRRVHAAAADAVASLDAAGDRLARLDDDRLLGPLSAVRAQLAEELPRAQDRAASADQGLAALIRAAGGSGPRRYLILSQNPDEVRPTGGFIGTYGVLAAREGEIDLERYASIESWYAGRPEAVVPVAEAPNAFLVPEPPVPQTLANVNATADWGAAGRLASELWVRGGEAPVDGVIGVAPEFLSGVLRVLGPVAVPSYGETVTAGDVIERIDFHTHEEARVGAPLEGRKRFIVELSEVVFDRLLGARASSWDDLGEVFADAFDRRYLMAWSADGEVTDALGARAWDGTLPEVRGDFFYDAEFAYTSKSSRGLRRTFDHDVEIRPDGSGRVRTTVSIANTQPFDDAGDLNIDSLSYITLYGPEGAVLAEGSDDPFSFEPPLAGHPAAGWDRAAPPLGTTTLTVVWDVPRLVVARPDGGVEYRLTWQAVPAHGGDLVRLRVALPDGWAWAGAAPPSEIALSGDFGAAWPVEVGESR